MVTREEIKKALKYLYQDWQMQNNNLDATTKFIYKIKTVKKLKSICEEQNIDFNYAIHRWYNFYCAKQHENIFIQLGAKKESNAYHKTIDFYLFDIPFDLKTTYFPNALKQGKLKYNVATRRGKNNLIQWLYTHQSKQSRFHLENRLFIICDDLISKSNFELIERNVKKFIEFASQNGINSIQINNKIVYSDIINATDTK